MPFRRSSLPFPASSFSLACGSRTLTILLPADSEAVLDTVTENQYEKDRFLPYWAEHWPSASPLFSFIMQQTLRSEDTVCDLGCGIGVIASALSRRGLFVTATDISPEACCFASYNISLNGGNPYVVCADWRALPFNRAFDLITASDVLYEQRWIEPILSCIDGILAPSGRAWIADPCRRYWQLFKSEVEQRKLQYEVRESVPVENGATQVEIIEITRQSG